MIKFNKKKDSNIHHQKIVLTVLIALLYRDQLGTLVHHWISLSCSYLFSNLCNEANGYSEIWRVLFYEGSKRKKQHKLTYKTLVITQELKKLQVYQKANNMMRCLKRMLMCRKERNGYFFFTTINLSCKHLKLRIFNRDLMVFFLYKICVSELLEK